MIASTQYQEETLTQTVTEDIYDLIVHNDEVNTFDHVIDTLINICEHTPEQAEQCTVIIHHKGKCAVKNGDFDTLKDMKNAICNVGISAEVS
jgi:ATP-dependent Clp protease adaptor protein ClpS